MQGIFTATNKKKCIHYHIILRHFNLSFISLEEKNHLLL